MAVANPYFRASKLPEATFRRLVKCFSLDFTATASAGLTRVSVRSVNALFLRLRVRIAGHGLSSHPHPEGSVEASAGPEIPLENTREPIGRKIVFGILQQNGTVSTRIAREESQALLQALLRGESWRGCGPSASAWNHLEGVVDMQFDRFLPARGTHGGGVHGGGTRADPEGSSLAEAFWLFARGRLRKFKGLPSHTFHLHLKECEFRFNHRHEDLYQALIGLLERCPL